MADAGVVISELSTHLQGQLVAVHPAYAPQFAAFAPPQLRDKPSAWQDWATAQLKHAAKASQRLKLKAHATFSGALLWHTVYPWPQRPAGLVEAGFAELAKRWRPILDGFDEIKVCTGYKLDGREIDYLPAGEQAQARAEPVYETIPGWKEATAKARSWAELPAQAIKYVRRIEELTGCPVALLSTSPEREDTILMKNPFEI